MVMVFKADAGGNPSAFDEEPRAAGI